MNGPNRIMNGIPEHKAQDLVSLSNCNVIYRLFLRFPDFLNNYPISGEGALQYLR